MGMGMGISFFGGGGGPPILNHLFYCRQLCGVVAQGIGLTELVVNKIGVWGHLIYIFYLLLN